MRRIAEIDTELARLEKLQARVGTLLPDAPRPAVAAR